MAAERITHTHERAVTVRRVEAQPASGPHRPAMPEHYVTELDGRPLCRIPASALAPLIAEAEARAAREALLSAADGIPLVAHDLDRARAWLRARADQAGDKPR